MILAFRTAMGFSLSCGRRISLYTAVATIEGFVRLALKALLPELVLKGAVVAMLVVAYQFLKR